MFTYMEYLGANLVQNVNIIKCIFLAESLMEIKTKKE